MQHLIQTGSNKFNDNEGCIYEIMLSGEKSFCFNLTPNSEQLSLSFLSVWYPVWHHFYYIAFFVVNRMISVMGNFKIP